MESKEGLCLSEVGKSLSGSRPSLEEVRESAREMGKAIAHKREPQDSKGVFEGLSTQLGNENQAFNSEERNGQLIAAEAEIAAEKDKRKPMRVSFFFHGLAIKTL